MVITGNHGDGNVNDMIIDNGRVDMEINDDKKSNGGDFDENRIARMQKLVTTITI